MVSEAPDRKTNKGTTKRKEGLQTDGFCMSLQLRTVLEHISGTHLTISKTVDLAPRGAFWRALGFSSW